jgi:hypothetical protein
VAVSRAIRPNYICNVSTSSPKFIRPCHPIAAKTPPRGEGWLHEPWLPSPERQGRTKRLARLAEPLRAIPCRSAVIDDELVLPDERGTADFTGQAAELKQRQHELVV